MTDTEKAALERRIDELCAEVEKYRSARDASVDLVTKTIDRIRELEAEVEQLKGKLFESLDVSHDLEVENLSLYDENFKLQQHLEAEKQRNAKLREQVDYMTPLALYAASEHERDRMRELGVDA